MSRSPSRLSRTRRIAITASMLLLTLGLQLVASTPKTMAAVMHHVYRTCSTGGGCGVYEHNQPSPNAARLGLMFDGDAFNVNCWVIGPTIINDPVWLQGVWNGQTGWVTDYFIDTRWNTTADLTNQGIPPCGTPPPPPPGGTATTDPAVWIGSPFNGTWPNLDGCPATYPSPDCSLPSVHHILYYNGAYLDDWAADLQSVSYGTGVYLYAAPQDTSQTITARVETVGPACADDQIGDGGYRVSVAFYDGATRIGTVTYVHVNLAVYQGETISRWGTLIGTVGGPYNKAAGCWKGPHVHIEMSSQHNYACYNRGWHPGQPMDAKNFIGFIGGDYASARRQACP